MMQNNRRRWLEVFVVVFLVSLLPVFFPFKEEGDLLGWGEVFVIVLAEFLFSFMYFIQEGGLFGSITIFATSAVIIFLYLTPIIITYVGHKKGMGKMVILNLFFGWTVIGWIIALILAINKKPNE